MNLKYREVEQVTERLTEEFKDGRNILRKGIENIHHVGFGQFYAGEAIDKLSEYETAEDEGRLVVLPCSVGDTVWVITHPFNVFDDFDFYTEAQDEIYESYISSITFYENSNQYRIHAKETRQFIKAYFMESDFGKTVFLTREEAEKALQEMEKDDAAN